jgi:hypothetical protein
MSMSDSRTDRCTRRPRRGAALAAPSAVAHGAGVLTVATGGIASADTPCGVSDYSAGVTVDWQTYAPDFRISVTPTEKARNAQITGYGHDATVDIWHDVQACVPGLYNGLADSIWQQAECHVMYGRANWKTGPTFDFESWRFPLADPNPVTYFQTECLDANNKGEAGLGRNLPGGLDLPGNGNIA